MGSAHGARRAELPRRAAAAARPSATRTRAFTRRWSSSPTALDDVSLAPPLVARFEARAARRGRLCARSSAMRRDRRRARTSIYVSPKSGRAVSAERGRALARPALPLPAFFLPRRRGADRRRSRRRVPADRTFFAARLVPAAGTKTARLPAAPFSRRRICSRPLLSPTKGRPAACRGRPPGYRGALAIDLRCDSCAPRGGPRPHLKDKAPAMKRERRNGVRSQDAA